MISQGRYKHFKGGEYLVLCTALESTNGRDGEVVVVYVSLKQGGMYVRALSEFIEEVRWPDGSMRPRFVQDELPGILASHE